MNQSLVRITQSLLLFLFSQTYAQSIKFTEVANELGVPGNREDGVSAYGHGVIMADINNDMFPDIYITNAVRYADGLCDVLYKSTPQGFKESDQASNIEDSYGWSGSHGIVFFDYNNDGYYDLFNATTDDRNRLYKNTGDGIFQEVTDQAGIPQINFRYPPFDSRPHGYGTRGVVAFDANNDGYIDLLGVNWGPAENINNSKIPILVPPQPNEFYLNNGNGTFRSVKDRGLCYPENNSFMGTQGVTAVDVDNDGDLDVFISRRNYTALDEKGRLVRGYNSQKQIPNQLMINDGNGYFTDETQERGLFDRFNDCNGSAFADYDNDGDMDLFVVQKNSVRQYIQIYKNDGQGYFTNISSQMKISQWGFSTFFLDADNDGDLDIVAPKSYEKTLFYRNDGNDRFQLIQTGVELAAYDPRGGAVGDIDNDGDLDFYFADANKPLKPDYGNRLFRNESINDNKWLKITGRGPKGDQGGFGTRIWAYDSGHANESKYLVGYRQVISAYGYLCQDDPVQHFGLANRDSVDIVVKLLNGTTLHMLNAKANQRLEFSQPASIEHISDSTQSNFSPQSSESLLQVKIKDSYGKQVFGAKVTFQSLDLPASFQTSVYTDIEGVATTLYLPESGYGSQTITAHCPDIPDQKVEFHITSPFKLTKISGDHQSGIADRPLPEPFIVSLTSSDDQPVVGETVHFQVIEGDAHFSGANDFSAVTDQQGLAKAILTCGKFAGDNNALIQVTYGGTAETPVLYQVSTLPSTASTLELFDGNEQKSLAGAELDLPFIIQVTDAYANPVPDITVTFSIRQGNGSFNGQHSFVGVTDSLGQCSASYTLGTIMGTETIFAEAPGLANSPLRFECFVLANSPHELYKISGDNQFGLPGQPLQEPFVTMVCDSFGNPIENHSVTFTVAEGKGHFHPLSSIETKTDSSGLAKALFWMPDELANSTVFAESEHSGISLKNSPQSFNVLAEPAVPESLITMSGDHQIGIINEKLNDPFVVCVVDKYGYPVANQSVTFTSLDETAHFESGQTQTVLTDQHGLARIYAVVGPATGYDSYTFTAAANYQNKPLKTRTGSVVTFSVSTKWSRATKLCDIFQDSSDLYCQVDQYIEIRSRIQVRDQQDRSTKNQPVRFRITTGNALFETGHSECTVLSNVEGYADVKLKMGRKSGVCHLVATSDNGLNELEGSGIEWRIRIDAGMPVASLSKVQVDSIAVADGVTKAQVVFTLLDLYGNPCNDKSVHLQFSGLQISADYLEAKTDQYGVVTFRLLSSDIGTVQIWGLYENEIIAGSKRFIRFVAGTPESVSLFGLNQTGECGKYLAYPVGVQLMDALYHPIEGLEVSAQVIAGEGIIVPVGGIRSDSSGRAQVQWQLGQPGRQAVQFTFSGQTYMIEAIAHPGTAGSMVILTGQHQIGQINHYLMDSLKVIVLDENQHPLAYKKVQFTLLEGNGKIEPHERLTNSRGIASVAFKAEQQTGNHQIVATLLPEGFQVIFDCIIQEKQQVFFEILSGNHQKSRPNQPLSQPLAVKIMDVFNHPVDDALLVFTPLEKSGRIIEAQPILCNHSGVAFATWQIGTEPFEQVRVNCANYFAEPVTFNAEILNSKPVWDLEKTYEASVNKPFSLHLNATDPDGDPIIYHARNLPVHASFDSVLTHTMKWTPDASQIGSHSILLIARDIYGLADSVWIDISVKQSNRAPVIVSFVPEDSTIKIRENQEMDFTITALDPDDDNLYFTWRINGITAGQSDSLRFKYVPESIALPVIIEAIVSDTEFERHHFWYLESYSTSVLNEEDRSTSPKNLVLEQNYPNPFNPTTTIPFTLPREQWVRISIYNMQGQLVNIVGAGQWPAGSHRVVWDGRDSKGRTMASGIYYYTLESEQERFSRKLLLSK